MSEHRVQIEARERGAIVYIDGIAIPLSRTPFRYVARDALLTQQSIIAWLSELITTEEVESLDAACQDLRGRDWDSFFTQGEEKRPLFCFNPLGHYVIIRYRGIILHIVYWQFMGIVSSILNVWHHLRQQEEELDPEEAIEEAERIIDPGE